MPKALAKINYHKEVLGDGDGGWAEAVPFGVDAVWKLHHVVPMQKSLPFGPVAKHRPPCFKICQFSK